MNAPVTVNSVLSEEIVRAALAQAQGRRPVDALSALLGLPSELFIPQAAQYFSLEPLSMAELRSCIADFGVISYVEATQRLCVAVTDAAQRRLLVLADPLDARTAPGPRTVCVVTATTNSCGRWPRATICARS